jgi:hypothetical protein
VAAIGGGYNYLVSALGFARGRSVLALLENTSNYITVFKEPCHGFSTSSLIKELHQSSRYSLRKFEIFTAKGRDIHGESSRYSQRKFEIFTAKVRDIHRERSRYSLRKFELFTAKVRDRDIHWQ